MDKGARSRTQKIVARPTMIDVAKLAGVSQATVSLVLNDAGGTRVNALTRNKVREAADALGYRIMRRSPAGSGAVQSIGFLVDDTITHPLVNIAIEGARQAAWENDCVLVVMPTRGDEKLRAAALDILFGQRLLGVIVAALFTGRIRLPAVLRTEPTVLINCYTEDDLAPALLPAHAEGAEAATRHLIEAGHRRIGFITGDQWMDAYRERLKGYRAALRKAGIAFDPGLVRTGDGLISGGHDQARDLLALREPPTALFCGSDRMAIGAYEALKEAGLSIPGDVSVIGFEDDPVARYLEPPLSTILVPHEDMGQRAVAHLLGRRSGDETQRIEGRLRLDCPLVTRASVSAPRG
ncbi:MAG: LacI family DNA-binding transcriptional regulator [Devosia sp.]